MGGCVAAHDNDTTPDTEPLLQPDETMQIIHYGWLHKKSRYLHKFHERWSVLTSITLYTFKSEHANHIFQHENGKSYLKLTPDLQQDATETILLNQYDNLVDFAWRTRALQRISSEMGELLLSYDINFNLRTSNPKDHIFEFQCASHKDKEIWCCSIDQALGNPDSMLIMQLKHEMTNKPLDIQTTEANNRCNSKYKTISLIQGYITVEVENDNVPSAVIQMICDYLFQRIECCFLSKRQPVSGFQLLLDRERLNEYTNEYSTLRFQNSEWFESSFDLKRMNVDLNNQRYPFSITTLKKDNKEFDSQILKSVDCTNHNKFKPFGLEYICSAANIELTSTVKEQIVRSEHMQSHEVKKKMKEMKEKFGDLDDNLLLLLAPEMDKWMKRFLTEQLSGTKYHLMVTKRKPTEHYSGGYWLHFTDFNSMFTHSEFAHFGRKNGYCLQMKLQNPHTTIFGCGESKDNDDLHRDYSFTYSRRNNSVMLVSETMSDIFEYDLDLLEMRPLNLDTNKWTKRRRDGTSLCWLNDSKLMMIGGHNEWSKGMKSIHSNVDLYDLDTNTLISLSNMTQARHNAASLYLQHTNEIAVGSKESVEFYDPTKDYWRLYSKETNERYWSSCFMWNDLNNPDILYLGEDRELDADQCHIEWIDRRMNSEWKLLETPENIAYFGQFYLNPNLC